MLAEILAFFWYVDLLDVSRGYGRNDKTSVCPLQGEQHHSFVPTDDAFGSWNGRR
jgi:hypothetical protein